MAILVSDIITAGNYFRRSTEVVDFTAVKQLEAAALAVEDVHSQALFRFTQRRQTFDYLDGQTDYSLLTAMNVQDFRAAKDLRLTQLNTQGFDFVDPNQFSIMEARNPTRPLWCVEWRDGQPIVRITQTGQSSSAVIHQANDHDSNGTWAADTTNSDATNVSTDTHAYKDRGGSIRFDADVSQSAGNNKVTISVSDMTAVDISAYEDSGTIRMWVYIPDVLDDASIYTTSVELRWGSSSSAYWSVTATKPVDHATWVDRWNLVEFKWIDSTKTGSPSSSAIDYLLLTINYSASQPDDTAFRINDINIFQPADMEFVYFSNYTVKTTSTNIWKARADATTDILLAPDIYKDVYVAAYNYYAAQFLYPTDNARVKEYERKYGVYDPRVGHRVGGVIERLILEQGERAKLPVRKLVPQVAFD